jgi:Cu-Zn family superoxide dismutase
MNRECAWLVASVAGTLLLASPLLAVDKASAVLKDAQGNEVGKATLTSTPSGTLINIDLTAIPPASTPSISMVGNCEPPKLNPLARISIPTKPGTAR